MSINILDVSMIGDGTIPASKIVSSALGASAAEKANIMLNSFRIEEQSGLTVQGMIDGVSDIFTDESGVDTATSTNELYNAAGDYYENIGTVTIVPTGADWTMRGSSDSYGTGTLNSTASGSSYTTLALLTGDFSFRFRASTITSDWALGGVFDTAEIATAASGGGVQRAGMDAMTNSFWVKLGTPAIYKGANIIAGTTSANTYNIFEIKRVSGAISWRNYSTNTTIYTWAGTYTQDMHAMLGGGYTVSYYNIGITAQGANLNSVIVSDTFTALSQPDTTFITAWHEDVDAVTLNTDFTIEVSRDAGTTWTAVTLALASTLGAAKIITGSVDISAQPAGTSMRWRAKFLNTISQRLNGVAMQWS
jgi:hypothetical protein